MSTNEKMRFTRVTVCRDLGTTKQDLYAVDEDGNISETTTPIGMAKGFGRALINQFDQMSEGDQIEIILLKKGVFNG